MQITKDMLISDVIRQKPETIKMLLNIGLDASVALPDR